MSTKDVTSVTLGLADQYRYGGWGLVTFAGGNAGNRCCGFGWYHRPLKAMASPLLDMGARWRRLTQTYRHQLADEVGQMVTSFKSLCQSWKKSGSEVLHQQWMASARAAPAKSRRAASLRREPRSRCPSIEDTRSWKDELLQERKKKKIAHNAEESRQIEQMAPRGSLMRDPAKQQYADSRLDERIAVKRSRSHRRDRISDNFAGTQRRIDSTLRDHGTGLSLVTLLRSYASCSERSSQTAAQEISAGLLQERRVA